MNFPLPLAEMFGPFGAFLVYLLIGVAFGAVLEMAGFGKSTRLAAQFYFKDLTVLKVMFGAIVVAMILIFLFTGLGVLDFSQVWVNTTYLWPGIVGGLIMGVGFIIGGFCPGTSLVAAATLKIDGILFALGAFVGIFIFGETVPLIEDFFNSSNYGRLTLPQWLNIDTGIIVVAITVMALLVFKGAEILERVVGKQTQKQPTWRYGAAGVVFLGSLLVAFIGQPANLYAMPAEETLIAGPDALIENRTIHVSPFELLALTAGDTYSLALYDVRPELDYAAFHIKDAKNIALDQVGGITEELIFAPSNTIIVLMGNDEIAATEAWRTLVSKGVTNAYVLEGGVNGWLQTFAEGRFSESLWGGVDEMRYDIGETLGESDAASAPDPTQWTTEYTPKVTGEPLLITPSSGSTGTSKPKASGGCG